MAMMVIVLFFLKYPNDIVSVIDLIPERVNVRIGASFENIPSRKIITSNKPFYQKKKFS